MERGALLLPLRKVVRASLRGLEFVRLGGGRGDGKIFWVGGIISMAWSEGGSKYLD